MVMERAKRKLLLYFCVAFISPSERKELKESSEEGDRAARL